MNTPPTKEYSTALYDLAAKLGQPVLADAAFRLDEQTMELAFLRALCAESYPYIASQAGVTGAQALAAKLKRHIDG